jgi:hypothetical protein
MKQQIRTERVDGTYRFVMWEQGRRTLTGEGHWSSRTLARQAGHRYLRTGSEFTKQQAADDFML